MEGADDPWAFDATTGYWQDVAEPGTRLPTAPPYRRSYPARLPDGRHLVLPLRAVPGKPDACVASQIANQASFAVIDVLAGHMVEAARRFVVDVVVGLQTLGLALAPVVAQGLGFKRFVPFGYSRKYWYLDTLSEPVRSLTTPGGGKLLYCDPNQAPLLRGRRVLLVDDAVSTGQTMVSALALLERCGAEVAAVVVAMKQGAAWRERLGESAGRVIDVLAVFESPRMRKVAGGWAPVA